MAIVENQFNLLNKDTDTLKVQITQFNQKDQNDSDKDEIEEEKGYLINQLDFENQEKISEIEKAYYL